MFTSADVAALADAAGLLAGGFLDPDGLVALAWRLSQGLSPPTDVRQLLILVSLSD